MRLWALGQLDTSRPNHVETQPNTDEDDDPDHEADDEEPDEADLAAAAMGIRIEGPRPGDADGDVWLWPECVGAWAAWLFVQTQWQLGPSGHRVGLDHAAVLADLRALGHGPGKRRSLRRAHGDLIAMEGAALAVWADEIERERRAKG